ncbi:MAG: glutamine-hydrolyzing carbamoyl-phosphate synthase small subunit [Candidatus Methylomirabilis oxygeniifera]|uniref:Carbamoyl phosphate synthase small chain n=1 Tax=Methylomirabilis oxygeniifera TaxID=671143 RepID=D5MHF8_METO1|nr:MAG: glutamine-hydrolyzing carbamoyl-phosphate synthase small subunit [Candidatus Methylomirabilis oxyfera]CBE69190.1 carbamoyl phosphate synthetase, glutamine amidotransferase small subunit [Candidatus Methylomirabilis oxyfera]
MKQALLALADGTVFEGLAFGAEGETVGEVVFNTSMTGYQEVLTDPSYKGQMVVMTYPLIGNYGITPEDVESSGLAVEGFIVKEACAHPSNWRSTRTLDSYLKEQDIVGIQGIDTRALTRHLRDYGAMEGVISTQDLDPDSLIAKAKASPGLIGCDLVKEVACTSPYTWHEGPWRLSNSGKDSVECRVSSVEPADQLKLFPPPSTLHPRPYNVVAYDCGIKQNILRKLIEAGCDVTVVPPDTSASTVLSLAPDGVFLSNGPGDPEGVPYLIDNVRKLIDKIPIFGICLGHQILGLAFGGRTYKLKFGHHGGNQPVKDLTTGKVEITTQNHGFAVDIASIPDSEIELTHINLNDHTVEGMRHRRLPIFSVQYHPEASPGPHDASYLFQRFVELMAKAGTSR